MKCTKCDSEDIIKRGSETRKFGLVQRYSCNQCKATFYEPVNKSSWDKIKAITEEAKRGNIPEIGLKENLDGLEVTGVTYLKKDENNVLHWVKTKAKASSADMLKEFADRLIDRVTPCEPICEPKRILNDELCTQYTITDLHIGMSAWGVECGADWDLKKAYKTITEAMNIAIANAPDSRIGLLAQLGDFAHYSSHETVTPLHGNLLDADGRFSKMIDVCEDVLIESIDRLLLKHEIVKVIVAQGNHDISVSDTFRSLIKRYYRKNIRLEVICGPNPFYAYQHGRTMLGFHHGHLKKRVALPSHFAQFFSEMWGATKFRYLHCGHLHSLHIEEKGGCITTQHPTIAAPDAYASHRFDKTMRSINTITYHKKYGMIGQNIIPIEMVEDYAPYVN